jgi:DNA-directed RNA polymerase subunit RPC12/RpoP
VSAKCPTCGWRPAILGERSKSAFACPKCKSTLMFKTHSFAIRTIALLIMIPLIILSLMDDQRSLLYASLALVIFPGLLLLHLATEKLELTIESEF